jgi:hypothetical protein
MPRISRPAASPPPAPTAAEKAARPEARRFTMLPSEERPVAPAPAPTGPLSAGPAKPIRGVAAGVLGRMLEDERRVNADLKAALSGRTFSPQELIAMQAEVMKYSQELDVVSRVVDKTTGAVKQTMQTQV